jgi:predicted FMN-binding regulatory protein PaiB
VGGGRCARTLHRVADEGNRRGRDPDCARIEGKWKVSQNRPKADRAGVVAGLGDEGDDVMAALVKERGD